MKILAKEISWLVSSRKRRNFLMARSTTYGPRHPARTRRHAVSTLCGPARRSSLTSPRLERYGSRMPIDVALCCRESNYQQFVRVLSA